MQIKWKATIFVCVIILFTVGFANFAFRQFFFQYVHEQETAQVNMIKESVASYVNEKITRYGGSVNDWAHWSDPYEFMEGNDPDFVESNMPDTTFQDLGINFMIFAFNDRTIKDMRYYSYSENSFTTMPDEFQASLEDLLDVAWLSDDISCLIKIGNSFYFVASSTITDNERLLPSNGRLIFGKLIDLNVISDIERTIDCDLTISPMETADASLASGQVSLQGYVIDKKNEMLDIRLVYKGPEGTKTNLMINLVKDRDIFLAANKNIINFMISFTAVFLLITLVVFTGMGYMMSKPFTRLINEVKSLDLAKNKGKKLNVKGRDEFSYLRETINRMLEEIENEQNKVKENEERFRITLSSVGDGVIAVDQNHLIGFMNPTAQQLTGWDLEEAHGQPIDIVFHIVNEKTREKMISVVGDVFKSGEKIEFSDNAVILTKDGLERSIEETAAPIRDKYGDLIGCVLIFRDISEKKEKRKQIEFLSYHDQLTGLYNRRFFDEELKRLDTARNLPIALLFADINGLKTINDGFGHNRGDLMICQFAEELKKTCRSDDIIARTGGDEFVILLPKTDMNAVQRLVDRLKDRIEQVKIMGISLSVSFGWEIKNNDAQPIRDVLKKAEDFMYQKKIINSYSKRNEVIKYILNSLLIKSPLEEAHSKRVSALCESIAKAYGLSDDETRELRVAGELHDIGKIAIDSIILNKTEKLTDEEWKEIKAHPETGYRLLGSSLEYHSIAGCVLEHHERWDGRGYPAGLAGESIEWKARVIALADAYDAMTSERPYRKAMTDAEAVAEIKDMAGKQFDPDIVKTFIKKVLQVSWE
jgi:diguanylate cyclase (GGDEF)-like protein/PAS domain S-box-containing protein